MVLQGGVFNSVQLAGRPASVLEIGRCLTSRGKAAAPTAREDSKRGL